MSFVFQIFLRILVLVSAVFDSLPDVDGTLGVSQMISVLQILNFGLCPCGAPTRQLKCSLQAYTVTCSSSVLVLKSLEIGELWAEKGQTISRYMETG